jgi:hypothetical protein
MTLQVREAPALNLSHGQALWVLENIGFRTGGSPTAFNAYVMGLRRAGLPFAEGELGRGPGHNVIYRFEHLMELTVALALRAQAILSRDVISVLAHSRPRLRQIYRRAWTERDGGLGAPEWIVPERQPRFRLQGIYLDLRLMYVETGFLLHASPVALGPGQYIVRISTKNILQHMRDPLPITDMAEKIVELAAGVPEVRRGRPK